MSTTNKLLHSFNTNTHNHQNSFRSINFGLYRGINDTRSIKCYNPYCRENQTTSCEYCKHLPYIPSTLKVSFTRNSGSDSETNTTDDEAKPDSMTNNNLFDARNYVDYYDSDSDSDIEDTIPANDSLNQYHQSPLTLRLDCLLLQFENDFNPEYLINDENDDNNTHVKNKTSMTESYTNVMSRFEKLGHKLKFKRKR